MAYKHGRGKRIVSRMSRIMKEGNEVAKRLPIEKARNAKSRAKSGESSDKGTDNTVQEG